MKYCLLAIISAIALATSSCSTTKNSLPYFEDIMTVTTDTLPTLDYLPEIMPDDELSITVSSLNPHATALYQMPFTNPAVSTELTKNTTPRIQTYIVDSGGDINFPVLGKIHVAGMTTEALAQYLVNEISREVKDPVVDVRLVNFTVSVGGEVKNPTTIPVTRQRLTVLDALAIAGDLTEYGQRENVLVIREENGKRMFAHLNLNKAETLSSPYYYLKQNDYIYVAPNEVKQSNSKYNQNNAYKLSVTSTIVSAASVIASLVIALTIK